MKEIERKFLVNSAQFNRDISVLENYGVDIVKYSIMQGYLSTGIDMPIRIRHRSHFDPVAVATVDAYTMTVKANRTGITCDEIEFDIPGDKFNQLFRLCGDNVLVKSRYVVPYRGSIWEVDMFHGDLQGLVVAEIELQHEDDLFVHPVWVDTQVTADSRYANANLVKQTFDILSNELVWKNVERFRV